MDVRPKSTGWWQTLPGFLTATAAILTAIGGVIVALHQVSPPVQNATTTESPGPLPSAAALSPDPFYLASNPSFVIQQSNVHGGLQLGRVYWQAEVWIDNLRYEHAVGMHAPDNGKVYADFKVPPGAKYFQTVFGLARQDRF